MQLKVQSQRDHIEHCLYVLKVLNDRLQLSPRPEFKPVGESVLFFRVNAALFPSIAGDIVPDTGDPDMLGETPV